MFKTFIFKQHDDWYFNTNDTRCNKGPTQSNDISSTFNSLGKGLIKEPK